MHRLTPFVFACAVATLVLGAEPPPAANAPVQDWSNAEIVVVTPDHPGPAMWHIAKGQSEVWIIPTVSPVPKDLAWDSSEIQSLLKNAKGVTIRARSSVSGVRFNFSGNGFRIRFTTPPQDVGGSPSGGEVPPSTQNSQG